jgi:hypothetical protein
VESIAAQELHGVDTHLGCFLLVRFGHIPSVALGGNFEAILCERLRAISAQHAG